MQNLFTLHIAALLLFASSHLAVADFSFTEKDGTLQLLDDGKLVTAFRNDYRFPYLYPLPSPSGANIARHWPMEEDAPTEDKGHSHHRGLWLTHGSVNGYDFWTVSRVKGTDITIKSITDKKIENGTASFTADLIWTADGKDLLSETRTQSFSRPSPETFRIDFTSKLTATAETVVLGDTKEGTFAIRTDRTLRVTGKEGKSTLVNSNGDTNAKAWGKRANWAAYSGPDELGKPAVVAIIDHPTSFRHPSHWHAREYGLLAINPFGINDFESKGDKTLGNHTLKQGESITLRYTVIIHHGTLETAKLDDIYHSLPTKP